MTTTDSTGTSSWKQAGTDALRPWYTIVGCEDWDSREAFRAIEAGVVLYFAHNTTWASRQPDYTEKCEHNRAARHTWEADEPKRRAEYEAYAKSVGSHRMQQYALGTLKGRAKDIAELPDIGIGNETLNIKAYTLGAYVNAGLLSEFEVLDALLEATRQWENKASEAACRKTIESGLSGAKRKGIMPLVPRDRPLAEAPRQKTQSTDDAERETDDVDTDAKEALIQQKLLSLEVLDEARKRLRAAQARQMCETVNAPIVLTDFLAVPDDDATYRVDRLLPTGSRVILSAQYKAGKTSLIHNLVRALADGSLFLNEFQAKTAKVAVIDTEMDERQMRRWLRSLGIGNTGNVCVKTLRGNVSAFNILDSDVFAQWAQWLRGYDVVILDCLRPVLDALGLSEDHDAGQFLIAFDELLRLCGASEAVIADHMGHNGERTRGDSRKLDWPDATWRIIKNADATDPDDPSVDRYFSAYGRDVEVAEGLLDYTAETRELSYVARSRKAEKFARAAGVVVGLVRSKPNLSKNMIENAEELSGFTREQVREGIKQAVLVGKLIEQTEGKSHAKRYFVNPSLAASEDF
ncbi:AAA family ATPase [Mycobacterium simiae]|uniref:AAA family ATPase n=1 Tax=Mycobacterium simiae TaxID=1784 RepID=UPI000408799C|nr:AAA family ATPase [Mycobacterium simiae]PLV44942.1 hypothetical protein X011_25635 [Mycobacterium tuberculosis variant microti OV254]BBX38923.1 hypothetical protein MSIM_03740 [Mycobacterium simiae]